MTTRHITLAAAVLAVAACSPPPLDSAQKGIGIPYQDAVIADDDGSGGGSGSPDASMSQDAVVVGDDDAGSDADADTDADADANTDAAPPDACVSEATTLAQLIEGITVFDDATPQETIDAIEAELQRLFAMCPLDGACGRDELIDALQALIAIPIAEGTSEPRATEVAALQSMAASVLDCATDDDCPYQGESELASLLAGVTELGDATSQELIDSLEAVVASLASACPFDETCELDDLVALLQTISSMPIAEGTTEPRLSEILTLQSEANAVIECIDGSDDDDGPIDEPFGSECDSFEWDRRIPYASTGYPSLEGCTVVAVSGPSGWAHQGDASPVGVTSFSAWERSVDDQGYPLFPSGQLLDQVAGASAASFFQSYGSNQFSSSLPLAPYMPAIRSAGRAFIIYGRNNAASVYALNPLAYVDDAILLAYEYGPRRDSIRVLGCPAEDLEGWSYLTFGVREAYASPFIPFVPNAPGLWAVVAICPAGDPIETGGPIDSGGPTMTP